MECENDEQFYNHIIEAICFHQFDRAYAIIDAAEQHPNGPTKFNLEVLKAATRMMEKPNLSVTNCLDSVARGTIVMVSGEVLLEILPKDSHYRSLVAKQIAEVGQSNFVCDMEEIVKPNVQKLTKFLREVQLNEQELQLEHFRQRVQYKKTMICYTRSKRTGPKYGEMWLIAGFYLILYLLLALLFGWIY